MSTSGRYKGRGVREIVAAGSGLGLGFGTRDFWDFWDFCKPRLGEVREEKRLPADAVAFLNCIVCISPLFRG